MGFSDKTYIDSKFNEFKFYIEKEIDIFDSVEDYIAASKILEQFPKRVELVVDGIFEPLGHKTKKEIPKSLAEEIMKGRKLYLGKVSNKLKRMSRDYYPTMGSFWESLGETLNDLSRKFKQKTKR